VSAVPEEGHRVDALTLGESLGLVMGEPASPLRAGSPVRFSFAGAESNVAIGLARLGHRVAFVSRVGDDLIGRMITESLRGEGVDVSGVVVDPRAPTALMVRQHRTADAVSVLYYRDGAAGSMLEPGDVPDLAGTRLLHVTGITPALSASARETVTSAVRAARAAGLVVSLDVNHRSLLWSTAQAGAALAPLLDAVDIVFGGDDELLALARQHDSDDVERAAESLLRQRPSVVVRKRGSAGATAYGEFDTIECPAVTVTAVDPVGAGDAFVAGFLSGLLDDVDPGGCLDRAVECGAFAVSVHGDWEGAARRAELGLLSRTERVQR
jgi:2-dehydro-3-deoxygluconokinase